MIASLRGSLLYKSPESLIIDVGGVGYEVFFPQTGHSRLPEIGEEVFLHIFTAVREDALNLYGFIDQEEKEMFCLLVGISGIGPKMAINILSSTTPSAMARAIATDDIPRLKELPGIGKKTAERLCLELKDKMPFIPDGKAIGLPASTPEMVDDQRANDVLSALVNLGYSPVSAKEALKTVRQQIPEETYSAMRLEELLRQALRSLA